MLVGILIAHEIAIETHQWNPIRRGIDIFADNQAAKRSVARSGVRPAFPEQDR